MKYACGAARGVSLGRTGHAAPHGRLQLRRGGSGSGSGSGSGGGAGGAHLGQQQGEGAGGVDDRPEGPVELLAQGDLGPQPGRARRGAALEPGGVEPPGGPADAEEPPQVPGPAVLAAVAVEQPVQGGGLREQPRLQPRRGGLRHGPSRQ